MNMLEMVKNTGEYTDLSIYNHSVFGSVYKLKIDESLSLELRYLRDSEEYSFSMQENGNGLRIDENLKSISYIHNLIGVNYYENLKKLKVYTDKIELNNKLNNKLVEKSIKFKKEKI